MIYMGDSITNFIELLTKGDFFLIFLIAMMLIIIGVIVYLVRLQISDAPEYDKKYRDIDDDEEDEDYFDDAKIEEKITKEVLKPTYSRMKVEESFIDEEEETPLVNSPIMNFEPLKNIEQLEDDIEEIDNKVDNMISERINDEEEVEELINERNKMYRDEDFESPAHTKPRFIEQSRFDFESPVENKEFDYNFEEDEQEIADEELDLDSPAYFRNIEKEETLENIRNYEDEQERTAIISASELESRINELKANGEYETHEKQLQKYEEEQETKAIISYEELLERAKGGVVNYESEEEIGAGIRVGKVDTNSIETYSETNEKPYYKEEAFLEAMKEFRRAL